MGIAKNRLRTVVDVETHSTVQRISKTDERKTQTNDIISRTLNAVGKRYIIDPYRKYDIGINLKRRKHLPNYELFDLPSRRKYLQLPSIKEPNLSAIWQTQLYICSYHDTNNHKFINYDLSVMLLSFNVL